MLRLWQGTAADIIDEDEEELAATGDSEQRGMGVPTAATADEDVEGVAAAAAPETIVWDVSMGCIE